MVNGFYHRGRIVKRETTIAVRSSTLEFAVVVFLN